MTSTYIRAGRASMAQQKKKKATIREVAQQAGVSYQTVSRVLNASESVAEETRRRGKPAAQKLRFVPRRDAQIVNRNPSRTLQFVGVGFIYAGGFSHCIHNMAVRG